MAWLLADQGQQQEAQVAVSEQASTAAATAEPTAEALGSVLIAASATPAETAAMTTPDREFLGEGGKSLGPVVMAMMAAPMPVS
jgi:hypothetical protein